MRLLLVIQRVKIIRSHMIDLWYMVHMMSNPETVKVLKEERIPPTEMEKKLSEFLRKKDICDRISKEDLTRLKALQETLEEEQWAEPP